MGSSTSVVSAGGTLPLADRALDAGFRRDDSGVGHVQFVEKAVLACPLPHKALVELGRWSPLALLLLAPAWSYHLSGPADHWWFVSCNANHRYFYAAQFCSDDGGNHVSGDVFLGMQAAIDDGLQYAKAHWWLARPWVACSKPRSKEELDKLVFQNPALSSSYSWATNNCQHFAIHLYEGDHDNAA